MEKEKITITETVECADMLEAPKSIPFNYGDDEEEDEDDDWDDDDDDD